MGCIFGLYAKLVQHFHPTALQLGCIKANATYREVKVVNSNAEGLLNQAKCVLCLSNYIFYIQLIFEWFYTKCLVQHLGPLKNVISTVCLCYINCRTGKKATLKAELSALTFTICMNSVIVEFASHLFQQSWDVCWVFPRFLSAFLVPRAKPGGM